MTALPPKPQQKSSARLYRAMFDYIPEQPEANGWKFLAVEEGEIIMFVEEIDDDWIVAKVGDNEGLVPRNFIDENASQVFPLHDACRRGNIDQVNKQLQFGVPINQLDKTNGSPIYYGAQSGDVDVVKTLLATGFVNLNYCNNLLESCVHAAAAKGHRSVIEIILAHNEKLLAANDPNGNANLLSSKNKFGKAPIDIAQGGALAILREKCGEQQVVMPAFVPGADSDDYSDDE